MVVDYLDPAAFAATVPRMMEENRDVVERMNLREAR